MSAMNIFLSHSDKDMWYVPHVVDAATFVGASVTRSKSGEGLSDRVMEEIDRCHLVVCISTIYTMDLPEVQEELRYAQGREKLILPIAVGGTGECMMDGIDPLMFDECAVEELVEGIALRFMGHREGWDMDTSFKALLAAGAMVSALEQIFEESRRNDV